MDRTAEIFKMELELAKVSNRLKLATHAANIGIWEVDIESGLLECNEVMFKLYGVENNETLKYYKSWMELIHPVDRKKFLDNFMLAFEGKKPLKLEFRTIWKDGTIHFIKSESVIVRNSEGKVMKLIGTNLDITNEMQYELELLKAKEQAEIANGLKSQFLANMSHEIRTPMNGIIGFLDLLQFTKLTYEQVEYVKEAKIASTMLLHLINDILDFSKIEAGKIIMEDDAFNLRKTVDDVVSMLYPRAKEKNIDIFVNINENVPDSLSGDAIRLKQV
jgi:PAS domain S-box-containing protein